MFINRDPFHTPVMFRAEPAGGGGAPAPSPVQPGQGGDPSGDPSAQPGQGAEAFWGMFPDVPPEMRPQLEPHLRNVQSHVGRVTEQLSAFRPLIDAGYDAQQVQGLAQFAQHFDQDPLGAWLQMGQLMQQEQAPGQPGLVDPELDFDYLGMIARGEELPDEDEEYYDDMPVGQEQQQFGGQDLPPQVLQYIEQMQNRLEQLENGINEDKRSAAEKAQQRALVAGMARMRSTLKGQGYPEEALTDDFLRTQIIMARGNIQQATKNIADHRTAVLKGFTASNNGGPEDLDARDLPAPGEKPAENSRDPFSRANAGARAFLKRQNQSAAQG